jgi:hypothetical protein
MILRLELHDGELSVKETVRFERAPFYVIRQQASEYETTVFSQPLAATVLGARTELLWRDAPKIKVTNAQIETCTYFPHLPVIERLGDVGYYSIAINLGKSPVEFFETETSYLPIKLPGQSSLTWCPIFENEDYMSPVLFKEGRFRLIAYSSESDIEVSGIPFERDGKSRVVARVDSLSAFPLIKFGRSQDRSKEGEK